jgi:hypothetical protein
MRDKQDNIVATAVYTSIAAVVAGLVMVGAFNQDASVEGEMTDANSSSRQLVGK